MDYTNYSTGMLQKWLSQSEQKEDYEVCKAIKDELDAREKGERRKLIFVAQMQAIDQTDKLLKTYQIARIKAYSEKEAMEFCRSNAPYLRIIGKLVSEISANGSDEGMIEFIE